MTSDLQRPFLEHLAELRLRLLRGIVWLAVATAVSWGFAPQILSWLIRPVGQVVYLSPAEPFLMHVKAAFLGGIGLSFPLLAWEGWGFLQPGLRPRERRWIAAGVLASAGLFFLGAWLGWSLLLPAALKILSGFETGFMIPMITMGHYVSFAGWLLIGCGVAFQMPMIILFLSRTGLVHPRRLLRQWRLVFVALLILAALLTPGPDVVSQLLLAVPLAVLYLVSVALASLFHDPRSAD